MSKTSLINRVKQAEQAAAYRRPQHKGGMGAVYYLINNPERIRTPQLRQMLSEMTTAELLELRGHYVEDGIDLSSVPTEILLKARDSRNPDKVLADWIGEHHE